MIRYLPRSVQFRLGTIAGRWAHHRRWLSIQFVRGYLAGKFRSK